MYINMLCMYVCMYAMYVMYVLYVMYVMYGYVLLCIGL